jgi:hypothetical protein
MAAPDIGSAEHCRITFLIWSPSLHRNVRKELSEQRKWVIIYNALVG